MTQDKIVDGHANQPQWQFSLAGLLVLTAGSAIAISAFMTLGGVGRFFTVVAYSSFLGYVAGRSFRQNHVESGVVSYACAFLLGTLYGVYVYPLLEGDYHDASSIIGVLCMAGISGSVISLLIAVMGSLLHR